MRDDSSLDLPGGRLFTVPLGGRIDIYSKSSDQEIAEFAQALKDKLCNPPNKPAAIFRPKGKQKFFERHGYIAPV